MQLRNTNMRGFLPVNSYPFPLCGRHLSVLHWCLSFTNCNIIRTTRLYATAHIHGIRINVPSNNGSHNKPCAMARFTLGRCLPETDLPPPWVPALTVSSWGSYAGLLISCKTRSSGYCDQELPLPFSRGLRGGIRCCHCRFLSRGL